MKRPSRKVVAIALIRAACLGVAFWLTRDLVWWKRFGALMGAAIAGVLTSCGGSIDTPIDAGVEADVLELDAAADVAIEAAPALSCVSSTYDVACGEDGAFVCYGPASPVPHRCNVGKCSSGARCVPLDPNSGGPDVDAGFGTVQP